MSDDFKLPELPSDEELGIADEPAVAEGSGPASSAMGAPVAVGDVTATSSIEQPAPERRTRSWSAGLLTLAVLLVGGWLSSSYRSMPTPKAANAPDTAFSSARALATVVDLARAPHPPGSPEHDRIRGVLVERLEALGLEPEVHVHRVSRRASPTAPVTVATIRNVIARLPGAASTGTLVLMAHYDGRTVSRAAGDDASGVAVILETLRALQASEFQPDNDLLVLFTDAEESGLFGARGFVDQHLDSSDVRLVMNVEMRGGGGPSVMFETATENGWAIEQLKALDPYPSAHSMSLEVYRRMPNDTDFSPFRDAGVQGLNFAAIGRGSVYHQAYDDPAHLDEATLQHHGARLLAVARGMATQPLDQVGGPDRAYTTLPFIGLLSWPVSQMPLIAGVLGALWLVLALVALARGRGTFEIAHGVVATAITVAVGAGAGWGLYEFVSPRHAESGWLHGAALHGQPWYVAALVALAAAIGALGWTLLRRTTGVASATVGLALPAVAGSLVLAFAAPGATPVTAGPAAALLAACLVASLAGPRHEAGTAARAVYVASALVTLAFLVPVIELVADAMTLQFAMGLGVVSVLGVLALGPALEGLRLPNAWWMPALGLAAAAAFTWNGLQYAKPGPERPAPSTLVYLQDQGAPQVPVQAWWLTALDGGQDWASRQTSATFEPAALDMDRYALRLPMLAAPAPALTLEPLRLQVLGDTVVGAGRRVRIGIPYPRQPEQLRVELDPGAGLIGVDGDELAVSIDGRPRSLVHLGRPADSLLAIDVELPLTATSLDLSIQEELQRPWELLGRDIWRRPDELAPNIRTESDRALIRSHHRVLLDMPVTLDTDVGPRR